MEDKVDAEGAEVQEGREDAPILFDIQELDELLFNKRRIDSSLYYLAFVDDGVDAVEHVERADNMTLYQHAGQHHASRPPACTEWHFEEPLF